jgi:hypothetical protein
MGVGLVMLKRLVLLSLVVLALGCGEKRNTPPTAPVTGKVTYKGKPVIGGTVTFNPEEALKGNPGSGDIAEDGTYSLTTYEVGDGAVLGKHTVTVQVFPGQRGGPEAALPGMESKLPSPIPKKYADPSTSKLTFEVKEGDNVADLTLED